MTQPKLAFAVRGCGRMYPWPPQPLDDLPRNQWGSVNPEDLPSTLTPLPSITNILSIVDKPALKGWAAEQAIRALYAGPMPPTADEAVAVHKYAFNKVSKERADAGTRAHTLAERLTQDLPLPSDISEEDEAFADAYMAFWADWSPTPLHVEATVFDPETGYAGTGDLFAEIAGKTVVVDWKTRGVKPDEKKRKKYPLLYDETRMQLAALALAPWVYADDTLVPAPEVVEGWGVVLYPDGTYAHEVLDRAVLEREGYAFEGLLRAWRVRKGMHKEAAA